jgi:hypothetical protein
VSSYLKRETTVVAAVLLLLVAITYAAPLFGVAKVVGRDHLTLTLPGKQVIADSLRDGHLQ